MIRENIAEVKKQISEACRRTDRQVEDVTLIAVSKTKPLSDLKEAYAAGLRDFGENKVQELMEKYESMPEDTRFHMIGHLQRNKVKYLVGKVFLIHSVDSIRLAEEISKEACKQHTVVNILVEVNVAGEESKFGTTMKEAAELVEQIARLEGICVKGLMTIAPYVEDSEENRQHFVNLRQLAVDIRSKNIDNVSMEMLSMGMTGDYVVAVEEGATYVRVGTGIFGNRNYAV